MENSVVFEVTVVENTAIVGYCIFFSEFMFCVYYFGNLAVHSLW